MGKKQGISYKTAWRWVRQGKMPVPFVKTPTGTILVKEPEADCRAVALDARVSSADQKPDLDRQIARLVTYASEQGWAVRRAVCEIGSGITGHRPRLLRLLSDPKVNAIVVEHRDRLMRFGFEYVKAALAAPGRGGLLKNPKLARHIADMGWGEFRRMLAYKCTWYGSRLVEANRYFPSSKTCSACGHVMDKMPLPVREWTCPACGAYHDRDVNAAKNLLALAI